MNQTQTKGLYKKLFIVCIIAALVLAGIFVHNSRRFHVTGTSPNNKHYPSSLISMDIYFSKELNVASLKRRVATDRNAVVEGNFDSAIQVSVNKDHLSLVFAQTPAAGSYSIHLKSITALSRDSLDTTIPFIVQDIKYDDLTDSEKQQYDKLSDDTSDSSDLNQFPILAILPYETSTYLISYKVPEEDSDTLQLIITMKFFEPGNNAVPATATERADYLAMLRSNRRAALDYIQSKGFKLSDYAFQYTETDLQDEFPKGKSL